MLSAYYALEHKFKLEIVILSYASPDIVDFIRFGYKTILNLFHTYHSDKAVLF